MAEPSAAQPAWGTPLVLTDDGDIPAEFGDNYYPSVAADSAGNWVAVWLKREYPGLSVVAARSTDAGQTWSEPGVIESSVDGYIQAPQVATNGAGTWIAVWQEEIYDGTSGLYVEKVMAARSADAGATWGVPQSFHTANDDYSYTNVSVAGDASGNWVVAWSSYDAVDFDNDILFSRSSDNGATWSGPLALDTNAATDFGYDYRPVVSTDGANNWVSVWRSSGGLGGTIGSDGDILVSRSNDAGVTWSPPAALNSDAASDSRYDDEPDLFAGENRTWVAVWHAEFYDSDLGYYRYEIMFSRSTDAGLNWSAPASIAVAFGVDDYFSAPHIAGGANGVWVAVWGREYYDINLGEYVYDILFSRSAGDGATWSAPGALSATITIYGYEGIDIATDGNSVWLTLWLSYEYTTGGSEILVSRSADNGAAWSTPTPLEPGVGPPSPYDLMPQIATDGGSTWIAVWMSTDDILSNFAGSTVQVSRSTNGGSTWGAPVVLADLAGYYFDYFAPPRLATDGAVNWIVTWSGTDPISGDGDVYFVRSGDSGETWTEPVAINSDAASDSTDDFGIAVAASGDGTWVAAWSSYDDSLGTVVIRAVRSTDGGAAWSPPQLVASGVGYYGQFGIDVATDGAGTWLIAGDREDAAGGDTDLLLSKSSNDGMTWTESAAPLNTDAATDSEDDFAPRLAADGNGGWVAVWISQGYCEGETECYPALFAHSSDGGAT